MNTNILKKCVEELKKETPNIPYVLGMVETLIEFADIKVAPVRTIVVEGATENKPPKLLNQLNDEEEGSGILGAYLKGPISNLES